MRTARWGTPELTTKCQPFRDSVQKSERLRSTVQETAISRETAELRPHPVPTRARRRACSWLNSTPRGTWYLLLTLAAARGMRQGELRWIRAGMYGWQELPVRTT